VTSLTMTIPERDLLDAAVFIWFAAAVRNA
jgi:hypothetical protein